MTFSQHLIIRSVDSPPLYFFIREKYRLLGLSKVIVAAIERYGLMYLSKMREQICYRMVPN